MIFKFSSSNSKITAYIKESKNLAIPLRLVRKGTKKFTTVIGKGGYGVVYKGELLLSGERTSVAVKRLDSKISGQGFKEFLTEIQLLSRYKHPNVVSLLGFCDEAGEKILIYEYAEHRSLDKHLSASKIARPLTWEQRIRICLDTARGLDYLHNHIATNHRVIHRDIKSGNILIGHDWKAMIADLGLSKIGRANESGSYLITNASGTHGYCDPAYMNTGILTKESDVYSFGVVMFEVLCGRLAFMDIHNEHRFLAPLAHHYYETGRLNEIIDPYLKTEVDSDSLKRFSEIAYPCLLNERDRRPSMGFVVQKLEEMIPSSKVLQINLKLAAQGPKKGNFLSRYVNANAAYSVLGHKTDNIRDIFTYGKKLLEVEFRTIYLVFVFFPFVVLGMLLKRMRQGSNPAETGNIRNIFTYGRKLQEVEFGTIYLVFVLFWLFVLGMLLKRMGKGSNLTDNIRDIFTYGKKLWEVEFGIIHLVLVFLSCFVLGIALKTHGMAVKPG